MADYTVQDLQDNLDYLNNTKQIIKQSIVNKGQSISDTDTFRSYADKISAIETGKGDVKLFETEEAMQADTKAEEGDLAVVYRNEVNNVTADSRFQYITFPETVTLPTAVTTDSVCMLRAVDSSNGFFDGQIMLDVSMFRFNGYSETEMIRVEYSSADGINYTRTRFEGDNGELTNPVDLGTEIRCEMQEEWNDNFGYFMQIAGNTFEGLFECNNIPNPDTVSAYKFYKYIEENGERIPDKEDTEFTKEEVTLFKESMENSNFDSLRAVLIKDLDTEEYYVVYMSAAVLLTSEKAYICGIPPRDDEESVDFSNTLYKVNTNTKTLEKLDTASSITAIQGDDCWFGCSLPNMNKIQISKVGYPSFEESDVRYYANNKQYVNIDLPPRTNVLKYELAPTQFNLTASNELLPAKIAYGKNGVVTGDDTLYDNIPWNDEIFSKIDTNIVLSGLGSMCTGMYNSRSINNSLVANKFLTPTSGTSDICLNFDFDHKAVLDYAKREFDENSFYNFMVIDNYVIYTFNKHNMGDFTNMTTYLVINNLETNQISSITIPDTFDGYWYNCYPVKDLATNKIYYLIGSGDCGADISQATTTQCLGYELNLDNLTATKVIDVELDLYYYVGYVVYNGKFYISYYNDIEQYNYIYKIENINEKTLLWSFDSIAKYEYWNYKFSYLAPYSIIQREDKIYFAAFYSNVLSYLYELDMTNNTVTQKVSLQTVSDYSSINLLYNGFMIVEDENNNDILYIVLMIKNADSDEIGYRINVGKYIISSNTITMSSYTPTTGPLRPAEDTSYIAYINNDKLVIKVNVYRPTAGDIYTYTYNTTNLSGSVTLSTDEHDLAPSRWYCQRQMRNGTLYVLGQGFSYEGQIIVLKNSSLSEGDSSDVKLLRKNGTDEQYTLYSIDLVKNTNTGVLTQEEYDTALSTAKEIEGSE